jgi:hypothetical protein
MAGNSIRSEMALAIRVVNLAYNKLPADARDSVELADDDTLGRALLAGGRDQALAAIADWRDRQLVAIGEAER